MYRNMQPYPSQQDHMYQGPHCYPGTETFPTQGYVNPVRPPMGYGWWPWGSGYGGASQMPNHGCCNHSYIPAHGAWGSPYSHATMHQCPVNYPSLPVQYMPPPPHYATNVPGEHLCCGCFNHPLHHGGQKNVRIEEEEPERERRKDSPVVPWVFHNLPDRIEWLPPENKEVKETGDMRDGSPDVKANEKGKVAAQQPTFQNGWFPLDLNNLVLPKSKGDGEGNKQDDGKTNFPYPLFWIPYKHEGNVKEDLKEEAASVKPSLESEADGERRPHANKESIGDRAATKARDIPVKEAEQRVEKVTLKKEKDASDGEKKVDKGDKVFPKEGTKRESSAPKKLPPVCLRVDPLPKRKNGNGSSQSPSPLSNKQKLDSQSNDASKVLNPTAEKEHAKILPIKEDKGTKTIEVVDGRTSQENIVEVKNNKSVKKVVESEADVSTNQHGDNDAVTKGQSEDSGLAGEKNEVSSRAQDMKEADEVEKSCKTRLSEEEAAVIIQSAYRGFDVRRWEPIKKLKQIAAVREQMADVKHLIQAMKSSFDIQARSKQRNIVAETIMSLLLKLDTIQGLAPSIREVRKSVVRELVNLQEQLDSLMDEKLESSPRPESSKARDEDALNRSEDLIASQNDHEPTPIDVSDVHQDQTDGGSNNDNSDLIGEQASEKIEKDATASCTDKCVELAPEPTNKEDEKKSNEVVIDDGTIADKAPEPTNKEDEKSNEVVIDDETIAEKAPEPSDKEDEKSNEVVINDETIAEKDQEDLVVGQGSGICLHEDSSSAKATDITATNHDLVGSELTELRVGVIDDFCAEEGPNDVLAEVDVSGGDQEKQHLVGASVEPSIMSEPHETAENKGSSQPMQTHEVLDLPFNIVELNTEETSPIERTLDGTFGIQEEVDGKTGNARIEPAYTVQQLDNFNSDMMEMPSHLLQVPISKQEMSLIRESANSDEMGAEAKSDDKRIDSDSTQESAVDEESQPQIPQACQRDDQVMVNVPEECNTKQPTPTETLEEQGLKGARLVAVDATSVEDSPARDEVMESNRKLSEENERLRNMMEKLIKSGQEQLLAISSLSERVKNMEKKLSRKKKLKVKQYRGRSSCMAKYDGKSSVGSAV